MTLFAGDEEDRQILADLGFDPDWVEVVEDNSAACRDDGPGLDWDEGPDEAPPGRRVTVIETTGERL